MIMSKTISRRTAIFSVGSLGLTLLLSLTGESTADLQLVAETAPVAAPKPTKSTIVPPKPWPQRSLDEVVDYNPFTWDGRTTVSGRSAMAADLLGQADGANMPGDREGKSEPSVDVSRHRARIILKSPLGDAVMAGNRVLRMGDRIEGFTVRQITLDAVHYEAQQATQAELRGE